MHFTSLKLRHIGRRTAFCDCPSLRQQCSQGYIEEIPQVCPELAKSLIIKQNFVACLFVCFLMSFLLLNVFSGLFTSWICESDPTDSGNIPSGMS